MEKVVKGSSLKVALAAFLTILLSVMVLIPSALAANGLQDGTQMGTSDELGLFSWDENEGDIDIVYDTTGGTWTAPDDTVHANGTYLLTLPKLISYQHMNAGRVSTSDDYTVNVKGVVPAGKQVRVVAETAKTLSDGVSAQITETTTQGKTIWSADEVYGSVDAQGRVLGTSCTDNISLSGVVTRTGDYVGYVQYESYLEDANQIINKTPRFTGTETMTFSSSAPVDSLVNVSLNGEVLDPANYEVTSGSTVITLKPEFVLTLPDGQYLITINSGGDYGSVSVNFKIIRMVTVEYWYYPDPDVDDEPVLGKTETVPFTSFKVDPSGITLSEKWNPDGWEAFDMATYCLYADCDTPLTMQGVLDTYEEAVNEWGVDPSDVWDGVSPLQFYVDFWPKYFDIEYNLNGHGCFGFTTTANGKVYKTDPEYHKNVRWDDTVSLSMIVESQEETYVFDGWWTAPEGGVLVADNSVFNGFATSNVSGSTTKLYAHWREVSMSAEAQAATYKGAIHNSFPTTPNENHAYWWFDETTKTLHFEVEEGYESGTVVSSDNVYRSRVLNDAEYIEYAPNLDVKWHPVPGNNNS